MYLDLEPYKIGGPEDRVYVNPCDVTAGFTVTRVCPDGTVVRLTQSGNKFQDGTDGRRKVSQLAKSLLKMSAAERVAASMPEPWDAADSPAQTA